MYCILSSSQFYKPFLKNVFFGEAVATDDIMYEIKIDRIIFSMGKQWFFILLWLS
jgi:hypothetical protein